MNSKCNEFYCIILAVKKKKEKEMTIFPCDKFQVLGKAH